MAENFSFLKSRIYASIELFAKAFQRGNCGILLKLFQFIYYISSINNKYMKVIIINGPNLNLLGKENRLYMKSKF